MGQGFKVAGRMRTIAAGVLLCAALESPAIDAELNGAAGRDTVPSETLSSEQRAAAHRYFQDLAATAARGAALGQGLTTAPEIAVQLAFDERRLADDVRRLRDRESLRRAEVRDRAEREGKRLLSELSYVKPTLPTEEYPLTPSEAKLEPPADGLRFGKLNIDMDFKTASEAARQEYRDLQRRELYLSEHRPVALSLQVGGAEPEIPSPHVDPVAYVLSAQVDALVPRTVPSDFPARLEAALRAHPELGRLLANHGSRLTVALAAPSAAELAAAAPPPPPRLTRFESLQAALGRPGGLVFGLVAAAFVVGILGLLGALLLRRSLPRASTAPATAAPTAPPRGQGPAVGDDSVREARKLVEHTDDDTLAAVAADVEADERAWLLTMLPVVRSHRIFADADPAQLRVAVNRLASQQPLPETALRTLVRRIEAREQDARSAADVYKRIILRFVDTCDLDDEERVAQLASEASGGVRREMLATRVFLRDLSAVFEPALRHVLRGMPTDDAADVLAVLPGPERRTVARVFERNHPADQAVLAALDSRDRNSDLGRALAARREAILQAFLRNVSRALAADPEAMQATLANLAAERQPRLLEAG